MRKFSMPLAALAAVALAAPFQATDLDAAQVQQPVQQRDRQQATDSIQGTIAERENGTFVLTTREGERMSFHVDEQTRVEDRQARGLEALAAGESVLVHYRAIVTRIEPQDEVREMDPQERERVERERVAAGEPQDEATDSIRGTLAQRENGAFTLVTETGERKTFHLDDPSRQVEEQERAVARQEVDLDRFAEGQAVTVHFRAAATNVQVLEDGMPETLPQERQRQEREPLPQEWEEAERQQPTDSIEGRVAGLVIMTEEGQRMTLHIDDVEQRMPIRDPGLDLGALGTGGTVLVHYRAIATRVEPRDDALEMDPQERARMEREQPPGLERPEAMREDHATDSVRGTLAQRENGAFTVVTETGERKTFHVQDRAPQVEQPEPVGVRQEVDLDRFEEGEEIIVYYRAVITDIQVRDRSEPR